MELRKIKCKSGNEYNIVNEYWETSRAWGHKSTLLASYGDVATHKTRYYNRTWESYTYQSCMSALISNELESNLKSYMAQYKDTHDIKRATTEIKEQIKKEWQQKEYVQDLMEIKERINTGKFD